MVLNPKLKLILEFFAYVGLTAFFLIFASLKSVDDIRTFFYWAASMIAAIYFIGRVIDTWKKL